MANDGPPRSIDNNKADQNPQANEASNVSSPNQGPQNPERRKFLIKALGLGASALAGNALYKLLFHHNENNNPPVNPNQPTSSPDHSTEPSPSPTSTETPNPSPAPTKQETTAPSAPASQDVTPAPSETEALEGKFTFDDGREDLSLAEFGLKYTPDGHITYFTTPEGKKRYFITATTSTWMIETDGQKSLKDYILSKELKKEQFHEVLKPTENFESDDFNNGYDGITKVLQVEPDTKPMHLYAIRHCEQRKSKGGADSYTATVALAESTDGGLNWTDKGPLIRGRAPVPPGETISGAGQPAAIIKDGYVHIIYIEWNTGADQLYSAKMKINDDGSLGELENLTDANGELLPVIPVPDGAGYAALPSVSFNEDLGKYVCIFETAIGFYQTTSEDLINWEEPENAYPYIEHKSRPRGEQLQEGEEFLTYPTYLSEDKPNDSITGKNGILYLATRPAGKTIHNLKSVATTIT